MPKNSTSHRCALLIHLKTDFQCTFLENIIWNMWTSSCPSHYCAFIYQAVIYFLCLFPTLLYSITDSTAKPTDWKLSLICISLILFILLILFTSLTSGLTIHIHYIHGLFLGASLPKHCFLAFLFCTLSLRLFQLSNDLNFFYNVPQQVKIGPVKAILQYISKVAACSARNNLKFLP